MAAGNEVDIENADINVLFQFFFETLRNAMGDLQYPEFQHWFSEIDEQKGWLKDN